AKRRNPCRFGYGPLICQNKFVWREADKCDYVCVTSATRKQTFADNAAAPLRRRPDNRCILGYHFRNAYPNDTVCVLDDIRIQVLNDNLATDPRLVYG
ncbi:unnamed protein product, partial [Rotaria sordida]